MPPPPDLPLHRKKPETKPTPNKIPEDAVSVSGVSNLTRFSKLTSVSAAGRSTFSVPLGGLLMNRDREY